MTEHNPSILLFLKQLQKVPYLASKNLYLVAQYFLDLPQNEIEQFCNVIKSLKSNIEKCSMCFTFKEKGANCYFCVNSKREQSIICVVESWRDLITIERTGNYKGVYHVLGGSICPLEGIGPDKLTISNLLQRVDSGCKELIFALNQTPEGEATACYIANKLKNRDINISCLARGLPVGSLVESMDRLTLTKALTERRPFN